MTKRRNIVIGTALGFAAAMAAGAATTHQARADCPGKIVCPLTGELVCRDQCPLTDEARGTSCAARSSGGSADATTPDAKLATKKACCR